MKNPPGMRRGITGALSKALTLHRSGLFKQARQAYNSILQQVPNHSNAHYLIGVLDSQTGRLEAAIEHYEACLVVRPKHFEARLNLANALQTVGRSADAISNFEELLVEQPNHVPALRNFPVRRRRSIF